MDSDDPDLEAFESNLRARELGRTAALVSNLCPIAADSQWIGVSSKDNAQRDSLCGTSSHRQSDSDDSQGLDKFTEWWSSIGNISKSLWRFAISLIIRLVTRYVARRSYHFSSSSYLKSCEANAEILGSCACLIRSE